jgi:hypothetical protein
VSGDPYRQAAEGAREIDAEVELFRHSLTRARVRTIFAVTYPVAAILVLGVAGVIRRGRLSRGDHRPRDRAQGAPAQ